MAQKASLIVTLKDQASRGLKKMGASLRKFGESANRVAKVGVAALIGGMAAAIKLASIQEAAINDLNSALELNGRATEDASQDLQKFASELQKTSTFGDEAIIAVEALLLRFTKLNNEGIKEATQVTADLAAALGIDLVTAGQLIGKTLGSSTNALARYGIAVEGAVGSQDRLNSLVENAGNIFGGAALSKTKTFAGGVTQLKNRFGDLLETVGFELIPVLQDDLIPAIDKMFSSLEGGGLKRFITKIREIIIVFNLWYLEVKSLFSFISFSISDSIKDFGRMGRAVKGFFTSNKGERERNAAEEKLEREKRVHGHNQADMEILNRRVELIDKLSELGKTQTKEELATATAQREADQAASKEKIQAAEKLDAQFRESEKMKAAAAENKKRSEKEAASEKQKSQETDLNALIEFEEAKNEAIGLSEEARLEAKREFLNAILEQEILSAEERKIVEQELADVGTNLQLQQLEARAKFAAATVGVANDVGAALIGNEENVAAVIGESIKAALIGKIDAIVATEIAKALAEAPLTFGATLAAIGPIVVAGALGRAAVGAIKFHEGGVVGQGGTPDNFNRPLKVTERRAILKTGETVRTRQQEAQLNGGGSRRAPINSPAQTITIRVNDREVARASAKFQPTFQKLNRAGSL